jgi:arsenate reductase (thioredoxin)
VATALFVCLHNAGRSQMAAADVVMTMGCGDACPHIPGKRYVDWELEDPRGRPVAEVRATRDDITRRVEALVAGLDRQARAHV